MNDQHRSTTNLDALAAALEAPQLGLTDTQLDQVVGGVLDIEQAPETAGQTSSVTSSGVTVCCW